MTSAAGESKLSVPPVQGSVADLICQPDGKSIEIPWIVELNLERPGEGEVSTTGMVVGVGGLSATWSPSLKKAT